jgi:hypothetical protein
MDGARIGVVLVILGLLVAGGALVWSINSDSSSEGDHLVTGTATFRKGERSTPVVVAGILKTGANPFAQFAGRYPRSIGVFAKPAVGDQFRVKLTKKAPRPLTAQWSVTVAGEPDPDDHGNVLAIGILSVAGVLLLLCAFVLARITATGAILFAAFSKVAGLMLTIGVGLAAAIIASEATNSEPFTALFTLLGLVAGYLAGTKTEPQDDEPSRPVHGDDEPPPDGGATKLRQADATQPRPAGSRSRSLL